jgi:hypothetical protein
LFVSPLPGRRLPWTSHPLLAGTPYRTTVYRFTAARSGPVVLLFAPHGDERSAGHVLNELVRTRRPDRGTLLVCPFPVLQAWQRNKRYWMEDMNRQFMPSALDYTPMDIVAAEVKHLIRSHGVRFFLNIHEGWLFFKDSWREYGQSIVVDTPAMGVLAGKLVGLINRSIPVPAHRFYPALKPMPGTFTFWAEDAGLAACGVEISRDLPWGYRVRYQWLVIASFLRLAGVALQSNR